MANLYSDYLSLLRTIEKADLQSIAFSHQSFWLRKADEIKKDLSRLDYTAYHLGTIPSNISPKLENSYFLEPQVHLQRVGLFADIIIFDDIVGHIINKLTDASSDEDRTIIEGKIRSAIPILCTLDSWVKAGIVKILPCERYLMKLLDDGSFPLLTEVSTEQSSGNLPDLLIKKLSPEQRRSLSSFAGHILIQKANKAFLLKEQLGLTISADDTFYDIVCAALDWNKLALEDISNIHVLKKMKSKYLVDSTDIVFELRKENSLSSMRQFFRELVSKFFSDDIRDRSNQHSIQQFSMRFDDEIRMANDELANLRRKFGSDSIVDLTIGSTSMLLGFSLDYGATFASWLPKIAASFPAAISGKNILQNLKKYVSASHELKTKPTFVIGSHLVNK